MLTKYELEFEELLDEAYPYWEFAGVRYYGSQILKSVDPIHYDIALNEYIGIREEEDNE